MCHSNKIHIRFYSFYWTSLEECFILTTVSDDQRNQKVWDPIQDDECENRRNCGGVRCAQDASEDEEETMAGQKPNTIAN